MATPSKKPIKTTPARKEPKRVSTESGLKPQAASPAASRGPAHARAKGEQTKAPIKVKRSADKAKVAGGKIPEAVIKPGKPIEKRPVGRPSKYDPSYCEMLEAFMDEGYSIGAFAGLIHVDRTTISQWCSDHPQFSLAVSRAKCRRLLVWERAALKVANGGGGPGSSTMIIFGLKNMGEDDWHDKQDVQHSGSILMTHEEALKELE